MLLEDLSGLRKSNYRILLLTENKQGTDSLIKALADAEIAATAISPDTFDAKGLECGRVFVTEGRFEGFDLISPRVVVLSMAEEGGRAVMAHRKRQRIMRRAGSGTKRLMSHADLAEGDYVVHANYGIGLFEGMQSVTARVNASFIPGDLEYLRKGGRCSSVAALGANLLNLKPCIDVKDGKMGVSKKYRGKYAKCLGSYVQERLADRDDIRRDILFVTKTPVDDAAYAATMKAVEQYGNFKTVYETNAGCTVSCHCGPGTLGVLFVRK
jgi:hypothetical protein